ncbi:CoA transferase [Candidatus Amarobacter glycogenicus]|uniref:CaiB/BaiF CoA-transferase family protein n=1 Tax=Candidatus Amarobacter glycogenicus TaxID=3140699 RepID=UPI003136B5FE|nr:CoA transferase [Dehalococcoidia bacterium]
MSTPNAADSSLFLPLKGIRVLSFEVAYSLPAGTRTLAELGAEVVRVAGPGRDSFYIGVVDGVYLSKPCIGINLKDPAGLQVAKRLVAQADIVCSNFVPGVMERLGLGPDVISALNPSAIVLQLSGYGSPGPWSGYAAFGPSTEAAGGLNCLTGPESGPPIRVGSGVFSDQLGGRFAALGLLAALEARARTGAARYIDLSMAEAITLLVGHTVVAAGVGDTPPRLWNRDRDFAPQGIYPAKGEDEWLAITVKDDSQWKALAALAGSPRLQDSEFDTAWARHANHDAIDALLSGWTATQDKDELAELLQRHGVAASPVQKSRDPLFDPHLKSRGLFDWVQHERPILGFAAHPHPTTPWIAAGHARHPLKDIHFHGADNARVLGEWLGATPKEVAALEASSALIVLRDVQVEDRRTAYRDEDFAEQLGLPPPTPAPGGLPLSRAGEKGPGNEEHTPRATKRPRSGGLRVLELSAGPAAGFSGMLLAELGHEVIRVELPDWYAAADRPTAVLDETERGFLARRKKSVTLDAQTWSSQFLELASSADAVVEDLGPGGLGGLGVTTHRLRDQNRDIVVASISPYGHTGPKTRWQASELTIQASAGVLHSTGSMDSAPSKAGGFPAHHIAGINAATAVLARCLGITRGACGGGHIDVSMQETYIPHWSRHIGEWAYSGTKMRRELPGFGHQGFRHTAMTADGWIYVLSLYASWEEIALFFGLEEFVTDDWSNPAYRMEHWPELEQPYLSSVASKPRYQWFAESAEAGFTFAPVHSPGDQASNPHYAARGFLKEAEFAGHRVPTPGLPFPWDTPAAPNRPPNPGEHNAEILGHGAAK